MASNPAIRSPEFKLETEKKESEATVRVMGRITLETAPTLITAFRNLIPGNNRVVLDLATVHFIDSCGLGALVTLYLHASRLNCDLELANQSPHVRDLFRVSRLDKVFGGHEELMCETLNSILEGP